MVKVNTAVCTGCGGCVNVCPVSAITLREPDDKACINKNCNDSKICIRACPVNAISA